MAMVGYCARCETPIYDIAPHFRSETELMCGDCAYISGRITEAEYIKRCCFFAPVARAVIHEEKVYLCAKGEKLPWEKTNRDIRRSPEYTDWRMKVFERDQYTCAICQQVGGKLNAHHIRPFKDFPELRFDVGNGITLCESCHKRVHKEKDSEWIYSRKSDDP